MRTRSTPDHQDAVHRRLELLRAELAQEWAAPPPDPVDDDDEDPWWAGHTRLAGLDPATAAPEGPPRAEPDETVAATPLTGTPAPGRHAARRRRVLAPQALVTEPLRGRIGVGPWHLAVVALVVAAGLAATCWWVIRSDAAPVPAPVSAASAAPLAALPSTPSASAGSAAGADGSPVAVTSPSAAASAGGTVTVDVEGKVRHPGIVVLPTGSRVVDAVKAAGGALRRRALGGLNLAAVLTDGQQIVVDGTAAGAGVPAPSGTASSGGPGTLVNLNTATAEELDALPDVGPVTAQSILEWREQNGGFTSVDELLEVDGIGPVTMEKLTPLVTV
ncbi:helix-hairpin-helix domain-containing protein [Nocardioides cheoyonin]|uniref:helix-hairpin-helix domain-containing protein n=1 Tax=Nocardioides cheoyonin TaxID=3156615 RepID=UPI0032B365FD